MLESTWWSLSLTSWLVIGAASAQVGGPPLTPKMREPVRADSRDVTLAHLGSEPRIALVLGNAAYTNRPLKNPTNDASFMAAVLERVGFSVTVGLNLSRDETVHALNDFERQMRERPRSVALFYYAGHGVQHNGENYLIPVRSDIEHPGDLEVKAVKVESIYARLRQVDNRVNIVILDACRNNPFPTLTRDVSRGLAPPARPPKQSLIAYSTAPGEVAVDGKGELSVFTGAFANHVAEPGLVFEELFRRVVSAVKTSTGERQEPWLNQSTTEAFYFLPTGVVQPDPPTLVVAATGPKTQRDALSSAIDTLCTVPFAVSREYRDIVRMNTETLLASDDLNPQNAQGQQEAVLRVLQGRGHSRQAPDFQSCLDGRVSDKAPSPLEAMLFGVTDVEGQDINVSVGRFEVRETGVSTLAPPYTAFNVNLSTDLEILGRCVADYHWERGMLPECTRFKRAEDDTIMDKWWFWPAVGLGVVGLGTVVAVAVADPTVQRLPRMTPNTPAGAHFIVPGTQ